IAALGLNTTANGVTVEGMVGDLTLGAPPDVDLIVAGDVFYAAELAARTTVFLTRCVAAGIEVLVGDPGRAHLPHDLLSEVATYEVPDFGIGGVTQAKIFAFGDQGLALGTGR
ncbi:MAG: class I SAM-dependent methyltransferase, partial [Asticcacaulis sp.]